MKLLTVLAIVTLVQEVPQDIAKKDLPKTAVCLICNHGEEKPVSGVMYRGKPYLFCKASEAAAFKKDPEAYIPLPLPRPMPSFELTDTEGTAWNAAAMKGKLVLVDYWATWCRPCIAMMPMLHKTYGKYRAHGFIILSVSTDAKRGDFDRFVKRRPFPNPVMHDSKGTFAKWQVRSLPALFLVRDGQVVAQWRQKPTEKELESEILEHLKCPNAN